MATAQVWRILGRAHIDGILDRKANEGIRLCEEIMKQKYEMSRTIVVKARDLAHHIDLHINPTRWLPLQALKHCVKPGLNEFSESHKL